MSDPRFEHDLHRLFADVPPRGDADLFAVRVRRKLDAAWTTRRLLIGAAGLGGGVVAVWQLAGTQVLARVEEVAKTPLSNLWRDVGPIAGLAPALQAIPLPLEVVWLAGGMLLLAAGMLVTRVVDEL